jgi:tRNA-dihydrouridine synthase
MKPYYVAALTGAIGGLISFAIGVSAAQEACTNPQSAVHAQQVMSQRLITEINSNLGCQSQALADRETIDRLTKENDHLKDLLKTSTGADKVE